MSGSLIQSGFWNFDALFTPQDHPARELQDTFFIDKKSELPDKKLVTGVKKAHETGVGGRQGWQYDWKEDMFGSIGFQIYPLLSLSKLWQ